MPRKVRKEADICHDSRPCFARGSRLNPSSIKCAALMSTYEKDGECPFCKPKMTETKGKEYPINRRLFG